MNSNKNNDTYDDIENKVKYNIRRNLILFVNDNSVNVLGTDVISVDNIIKFIKSELDI